MAIVREMPVAPANDVGLASIGGECSKSNRAALAGMKKTSKFLVERLVPA